MRLARRAFSATAALGLAGSATVALAEKQKQQSVGSGLIDAIGNTPLIELKSLSAETGCRVLVKMENMNPGGSVKDRAAKFLIEDAETRKLLKPGGTIVEGTGGNTGIGLALVANAKGYRSVFAMPASIAQEKINAMKTLGAEVILCPGVPFTDPRHYFHVAAKRAADAPNEVFFTNQFENLANSQAHYESTAPEIWQQTNGEVHGFVCAAGTGGTIGGITAFLKDQDPSIQCFLIDPAGSALKPFVDTGPSYVAPGPSPSSPAGSTIYDGDREVKYIERSAGGSVTEGIGIDRVTANFSRAMPLLDGALDGSDMEAVEMAYYLLRNEGVSIGPSAALNVVGAVKLARKIAREQGPGRTVVTVVCDGGDRYQSKLFNAEWLKEKGLVPQGKGRGLSFVK